MNEDEEGGRQQRRAGRDAGAAGRLLGQAGLAAGFLYGSPAPRIRARHCRAKISGAAGLATQRSAGPVVATSAPYRATMHGAAQAFGRTRAIGAAKSVSFKKTRRC